MSTSNTLGIRLELRLVRTFGLGVEDVELSEIVCDSIQINDLWEADKLYHAAQQSLATAGRASRPQAEGNTCPPVQELLTSISNKTKGP